MSAPTVATKILFYGMTHGSFTGRKLSDYWRHTKSCINSRRINGLDKAGFIADYSKEYYSFISYTTDWGRGGFD